MKKKWMFIIIILISIFNIYKAIHCYICFNSPTHSIVLSNKNSDIIWVPPAPAGGLKPEIYSPWFQIVLVIQFINIKKKLSIVLIFVVFIKNLLVTCNNITHIIDIILIISILLSLFLILIHLKVL